MKHVNRKLSEKLGEINSNKETKEITLKSF